MNVAQGFVTHSENLLSAEGSLPIAQIFPVLSIAQLYVMRCDTKLGWSLTI
jgi:hypothetical protein